MTPPEMHPHQLMQRPCHFFKTNVIRYHVVGSMANKLRPFKTSGGEGTKLFCGISGMKVGAYRVDRG